MFLGEEAYIPKLLCGFVWLRIGFRAGYFEHNYRPLGSKNGWELLEKLNDYQLLTNASHTLPSGFARGV
jgi:hypothetical protein